MVQTDTRKEAPHVRPRPPPRPAGAPSSQTSSVRLEQLWSHLPQMRRLEILQHLTQMLAQRLASPERKETADE